MDERVTDDPMVDNVTTDNVTTIGDLRQMVRTFGDARQWQKFHAPKNISMALAIEAAELMEHFQWLTVAESRQLSGDESRLADVGDELADVVCYALALANELGLDLTTTMRAKMRKNEAKYPADQFQGRYE